MGGVRYYDELIERVGSSYHQATCPGQSLLWFHLHNYVLRSVERSMMMLPYFDLIPTQFGV